MQLEYQIIAAVLLDLLLGDPRWFPHPVKLMGTLAMKLETPARILIDSPRRAGAVVAIVVVGFTAFAAWALLAVAGAIHPFVEDLVSIFLLYTGIAARDMIAHSRDVYEALRSGLLPLAQRRVGMICGVIPTAWTNPAWHGQRSRVSRKTWWMASPRPLLC